MGEASTGVGCERMRKGETGYDTGKKGPTGPGSSGLGRKEVERCWADGEERKKGKVAGRIEFGPNQFLVCLFPFLFLVLLNSKFNSNFGFGDSNSNVTLI